MTLAFTVQSISIAGNLGGDPPPADMPSVSVFLRNASTSETITLMVTQAHGTQMSVGQTVTLATA